jgi:hypothetical protein
MNWKGFRRERWSSRRDNVYAAAWRNRGKPRKPQDSGVLADIRKEHLPDTIYMKEYHLYIILLGADMRSAVKCKWFAS